MCSQTPTSTRKMPVTVDMRRNLVHRPGYSMLHHALTVAQTLIAYISRHFSSSTGLNSEAQYKLQWLYAHQTKKENTNYV
jgi:hypothetical protein